MIVHEQRHTYDATRDPVATMTVTVECAPSQVQAVRDLLIGTLANQSLYSVDVSDHTVAVPEVAAPEVAVVPAPEPAQTEQQGDNDGEPAVLAEHIEPEAAGDGEGSPTDESGAEAPGPDVGEDGIVAWASGEGAAEGSLAGSA